MTWHGPPETFDGGFAFGKTQLAAALLGPRPPLQHSLLVQEDIMIIFGQAMKLQRQLHTQQQSSGSESHVTVRRL